jgi:hypothetical protein
MRCMQIAHYTAQALHAHKCGGKRELAGRCVTSGSMHAAMDVFSTVRESEAFDALRAAEAPVLARGAWPTIAEYTLMLAGACTTSGLRLVAAADSASKSRRRKAVITPCSRYDGRIYFQGELPTRTGSWHDYFNVLSWCAFPRFKAAINEAQVAELMPLFDVPRKTMPGARTWEQDRLAMIDEGGIVIEVAADGDERRTVFGHAIQEHVLLGRPLPVRGFPLRIAACLTHAQYSDAWRVEVDTALTALLPAWLAKNEGHAGSDIATPWPSLNCARRVAVGAYWGIIGGSPAQTETSSKI